MLKKKLTIFLLLSLSLVCKFLHAQNDVDIQAYIARYKDLAIAEMQRTGVPASVTLAQGIHETEAGTSDLVKMSNNHFGIKCKSGSGWSGESVSHDDDAKGECFRKYSVPDDSYRDHSDFLRGSPRYAFLFNLDPLDYESWCYGLKKAGYATNPKYSKILIKLIEDYNLQDYTLIAMGKMKDNSNIAKNENKKPVEENTGIFTAAKSGRDAEENTPVAIPAVYTVNYPDGEFKINSTRAVFIKKGTSYLTVAQEHEIPLARLFEFNDMKEQDIAAFDQLVFIQRKRKTGENEYHVVQYGESIYTISQTEGVRLESLLEYNSLKAGMEPAVGETLYLRANAPVAPKLAGDRKAVAVTTEEQQYQPTEKRTPSKENDYFIHKVQPKETLYSIARKYNVSFADVVSWNQLENKSLKTGQSLKIYR